MSGEEEGYREDLEDRLILDLLESRRSDQILAGEALPELRRRYVEVLGLLPRTLDEIPPAAEVRERILAAVEHGSEADSAGAADGGDPGAGAPRREGPWSVRPSWLLPLAATVAVVLMSVTGWLVIQVQDQRDLILELSAELDSARSATSALAASQGLLAEARSRLAMITAPDAEFCALNPPEGSSARGAHGVMVMSPKDDWFLRVEGLGPCPRGRKYTVWFVTEAGQVSGPIFGVKAGEAVELTFGGRPEKINAIMITLEEEPVPREPSMEPLLFGDERRKLL